MTDPKVKCAVLSEGAKMYLEGVVKELVYGYTYSPNAKYMEKGRIVEDQAIALYNLVFFTNHTKNTERRETDYWNSHGKWRAVRGQWMSPEYIAQEWEESADVEAGWFETAVEADDVPNCWPVSPSPSHPMPDPPCPTCDDQGAIGNILTAEPCPGYIPAAVAPGDAQDIGREFTAAVREADSLFCEDRRFVPALGDRLLSALFAQARSGYCRPCRPGPAAGRGVMRVLIACEYSGRVRDAFIARGHEAMSCDLLPTDAPGPHYQGDVFDVIDYPWDLMIAHPPCTHQAVSGARHFAEKRMDGRRQAAVAFFMRLARAPIPKIAIENPVCILSSLHRPADQIVQP